VSRELDARVALHVGYHLFEEMRGEFRLHVFYKTAEPWKRSRDWRVHQGRYRELLLEELNMGQLVHETLPQYGADIATAWKLDGDDWKWRFEEYAYPLEKEGSFETRLDVTLWVGTNCYTGTVRFADSDTKAEAYATARCLVFLEAKEK